MSASEFNELANCDNLHPHCEKSEEILLVQTACWYYFRFLKKYTSKERGISHGHGKLESSMYFYLKNIQGVKKHGMFNKGVCFINQLINKTK